MPEDVSFGELYKKLLDKNFEPDPDRSGDALRAILRRLSSPAQEDDNTGSLGSQDPVQ